MNLSRIASAASIVLFQRGRHGSPERRVRNLYAYRVATILAGGREGICPSCEREFYVDNDGEVDRTFKRADYVTGEITYLCGDCNQSRANDEWAHIDDYRAAVEAACAQVEIPSRREAQEWWDSRTRKPVPTRKWA